MRYYVGAWEYVIDGTGPHWAAPELPLLDAAGHRLRADVVVDFRPLPSQGDYTTRDRPWGIFATNYVLGSEYDLLGEGVNLDDVLATQSTTYLLHGRTGIRCQGQTLKELMKWMLDRGDPIGDENHRPITRSKEWGDNSRDRQLDVVRADIQRRFDFETENNIPAAARQASLGSYCRKYGIGFDDYKSILPSAIKHHHEPPEAPSSIYGTVFPNLTGWVVQSGTWSVTGNALRKTAAGTTYQTIYYNTALSSDDMCCASAWGGGASTRICGPLVRHPANADTGYNGFEYYAGGSYYLFLTKFVAGTRTDLSYGTGTSGDLAVRADGSDIRAWRGTTNTKTATDTAITGNTYAGVQQYTASSSTGLSTWMAGDGFLATTGDETIDATSTRAGSWSAFGAPGVYNVGGTAYYSAAGSGSDTAQFSFTVTSGNNYKVMLSNLIHKNRATDTEIVITGVVGAPVTIDINQEEIGTEALIEFNSAECPVPYQLVTASVQANSTTLTVEVNDNANEYVIADSCMIEDLGAAAGDRPAARSFQHGQLQLHRAGAG